MRISLVTNAVRGGWSPLDAETWRGGEETVVYWARAMAARGHEVTVIWDGPAVADGDVRYVTDGTDLPKADVVVCRKVPIRPRYEGARYVLWGEGGLLVPDPSVFEQLVVPTQFTARGYQSRMPALPTTVVPLGYDATLREAGADVEREHSLVLTASSPDRGLVDLLTCWPAVLEARPDARLEIAYGWELYDRMAGNPSVKALATSMIEGLPSVHMATRTRDELNRLYWGAGVWAYYCNGGEDYCLTAIKAQVAGAYPVVKPWGALHETVVPPVPFARNHDEFTAHLIEALDEDTQVDWSDTRPLDHCHTWDEVAALWEELLTASPPLRTSVLVQVPGVPNGLLSDAAEIADGVIRDRVSRWMGEVKAQHPWADPKSGISCMPLPPDTPPDAMVIGWGLEDDTQSPAETLAAFAIPDGTAVLLMTSLGPWRRTKRHRCLDQGGLLDVLGSMPAFNSDVTGLDQSGSAIVFSSFRYQADCVGTRNCSDALARVYPRESLSVCMIAPYRTDSPSLTAALQSIEGVADELVVVLNGKTATGRYDNAEVIRDWQTMAHGIPVTVKDGTSPRYCFDCYAEHAVGDMARGHRVAGFETPRNESVAAATCQWVLWMDTDEVLLHGERIARYLKPNIFRGYALNQDHFSSEPPEAFKRDTPMRLFRRDVVSVVGVGWDHEPWPTYRTGCTMRFTGLVHEHPGEGDDASMGADPVMMIPDVWLAHSGYYTEYMRRGRFQRNWPLMVADRIKYPDRRLGQFLGMRDLGQQLRYMLSENNGVMTPAAVNLAEEVLRIYRDTFLGKQDPFSAEADRYGGDAAAALKRGFEVDLVLRARCPELTGDDATTITFRGRVETPEDITTVLASRLGPLGRWTGDYR